MNRLTISQSSCENELRPPGKFPGRAPCLFNIYAQYIMRNAGLEEAQAGIKIAGRNINDLRYADDTILMAKAS